MNNVLNWVFDTSRYPSALDRERATIVYWVGGLLSLFFTAYFLLVPNWESPIGAQPMIQYVATFPNSLNALAIYVFYIAIIPGYFLTRLGYLQIAAWIPVITWMAGGAIVNIEEGNLFETSTALILLIIIAALLNYMRGIQVAGLGSMLTLFLAYLLVPDAAARHSIGDLLTLMLYLGGTMTLAWVFLRFTKLSREEGAYAASIQRLKLAEINTLVARRTAQRRSLSDVMNYALQLILDNYPSIYHAQFFLVDDTRTTAKLSASTGDVGQQLMSRGHALGVGSLSVIGQVTLKGQAVIARSDSRESVHRRNEFLPQTRVEAAFPLKVGDKIIGALDLQSKEELAMDESDISTFQSLADSFALAIDNVSQFERAEARIYENQQLSEQANNALRQVQRLNEQLIGRAWADYLSANEDINGINIDFSTHQIEPDSTWTNDLSQAVQQQQMVHQKNSDRQIVAVPLYVRGTVIGAMEFELDANNPLSAQELELAQEIGERFGLAAENTRLLQDSQRGARREALVNAISSRLQTTNNVETTLTEAARSLHDTLRVSRVAIRLGTPVDNQNGNGKR